MSQKPSLNLPAILLQAFFVVLGVVLALGANQWRENQNQQKHAVHALETIKDEIRENQQLIQEKLNYHTYLIDTLSVYLRGNAAQSKPTYRMFHGGFISSTQPLSTAWEAAGATDALNSMDFQQVLLLSKMYKLQDRYTFQTTSISGNIYETMLKEGSRTLIERSENLLSILYMFTYRERELISQYQEVLDQLEA